MTRNVSGTSSWSELWQNMRTKLFGPTPSYRIRAKGAHKYLYEEGERRAIIEYEVMNGELDLVVYSRLLKGWEPPHEGEIITEEEKQRILKRLSQRLLKQKAKFRIE